MSRTPYAKPPFQEFFDSYVAWFMLSDISREIRRVKAGLEEQGDKFEGGGNFLCALALLCHIEALGRYVPNAKNGSRNQFEAFFRRLGPPYVELLDRDERSDPYDDLRNGMAHGYVPKTGCAVSMLQGDVPRPGIHISQFGDGVPLWRYEIIVERLFLDFVRAADELYRELVGAPHPWIVTTYGS